MRKGILKNLIMVFSVFLFMLGCLSGTQESSQKVIKKVENPVFSVTRSITSSKYVIINCGTEGAEIYYTTNQTNPNKNSNKYLGTAVNISKTTILKAIAYKDGMKNSEIITQEVYLEEISEKDSVKAAYDEITEDFIKGKNTNLQNVIYNLNLPKNSLFATTVSWKSDNLEILQTDGLVARAESDKEDILVNLTADISKGNEKLEKNFKVIVKKEISESEDLVNFVHSNLSIDDILGKNSDKDNIFYDMNLMNKIDGVELIWKSTNEFVIDRFGKVTRPENNESDTIINLTATIQSSGFIKEKTFDVRVQKKSKTAEEAIYLTKQAISENSIKGINDSLGSVSSNLELSTIGIDGAKVLWSSNKQNVISNTGEIFKQKNDEIVELVAFIENEDTYDASLSEIFVVTVEEQPLNAQIVASPTFSVQGGTYSGTKTVGISCATAGATIRYTIDGTTPSRTNGNTGGSATITSSCILKAIAYKTDAGWIDSLLSLSNYTIKLPGVPDDPIKIPVIKITAPVQFSIPTGSYNTSQIVELSTGTEGANIIYTDDGSNPDQGYKQYSGPISIEQNTTIIAEAVKSGYLSAGYTKADYTINQSTGVSDPIFSLAEGTYTSVQNVSLSSLTSGAKVYYNITTDGSDPADPDDAATEYTSAIALPDDGNTTKIKAIAILQGTSSNISAITYTVDSSIAVNTVEISPSTASVYFGGTLTFTSVAKDASGEIIYGYSTYTYTKNGDVSHGISGATFTGGTVAEDVTVTVTTGNAKTATSTVTVQDPASNSFIYNGLIYAGASAGTGDPHTLASYADIVITEPTDKTFNAEGFFTLKGSVTSTDAYKYALVRVEEDASGEITNYWVSGNNFEKKIWLRFGGGDYTISVLKAEITTNNNDYTGDINGWQYWNPPIYTFNVNNTKAEDGRFYYPSDPLQSDSTELYNKAAQLISAAGATTVEEKAKALHDYAVTSLYYDDASLATNARKKQDALTCYNTGRAVCEGYTSVLNAMLRSQNIEAKALAGYASGNPAYGHAWSAVATTTGIGAGTFKLVDATWDDPGPNDANASNLYHTWFWKDDYSAFPEHTETDQRPGRAIKKEPKKIKDGDMWIIEGVNSKEYPGYPEGTY